jgi:solute carrier family 25 carnitine/acylcarnitine transporter 20/29
MLAPFLGITPIFAVYFLGFDMGKDIARKFEGIGPDDQLSTGGIMFAGGFSALPGTVSGPFFSSTPNSPYIFPCLFV